MARESSPELTVQRMNTIFGAFAPTGFYGSIRENLYLRVLPQASSNGNRGLYRKAVWPFPSSCAKKQPKDGWSIRQRRRGWCRRPGTAGLGAFRAQIPLRSRSKENFCASLFPDENDFRMTRVELPPPRPSTPPLPSESDITGACDLGHIPSYMPRLDCAVVAIFGPQSPGGNKSCV